MKMTKMFGLTLGALAVVCMVGAQVVFAAGVTFEGSLLDTTDYSPSGANIGNSGYLFANWDQTGGVVSGEEDLNSVNTLPAWLTINNDQATPLYSWQTVEDIDTATPPFTSLVSSRGGDTNFARLTLPGAGGTGLSGQFVDAKEAGNTGQNSNSIQYLEVGAGAPSSFRVHVVVDNEDASYGTGVRRVKMRIFDPAENEDDTSNGIDGTRNNIPDVHTFLFEDVVPGDFLQIALRSTNSPIGGDAANVLGAGFAGLMVDVAIPEPTSAMLLVLGSLGLLGRRRR